MPQIFQNTFRKMNNDVIDQMAHPDSYEMAVNAIKRSKNGKGFGIANEGSTKKVFDVTANIVGAAFVETRDWWILLLENGELGYFNTVAEEYTQIYNLNDLSKQKDDGCGNVEDIVGCDFKFDCEWIHMEYNFWNQCNELHIMFSAGCTYYTVNIDELLDPQRRSHVKCSDILTFKCDCIPVTRAIGLDSGGAGLPNGKYRFVIRLRDKDGHQTNFFNIGNSVSVGSGKNKPGDVSNQYVRLHIEQLNCRYGTVEIVVIKKIGGKVSCFILDQVGYSSNGISYDYRGDNGREIPIDIKEVLVKKVNYLQGRALKIFNNQQFYYQLKNPRNINIQSIANSLNVSLPIYRIPSNIAHKYQGMQPLERYLIGIHGNYCDATKTAVGVITGGGALEARANGFKGATGVTDGTGFAGDKDYNENPGAAPATGGGGSGGSSGGVGTTTYNTGDKDHYEKYSNLPPDDRKIQADQWYDKDGNPAIKKHLEDIKALETALKIGPNGEDCPECGADAVKKLDHTAVGDEDGNGGNVPCPDLGGKTVLADAAFAALIALNPQAILHYMSQSMRDDLAANCGGSTSTATTPLEKIMNDFEKDLRDEEVWTPKRVEVTVNNGKSNVGSGSPTYNTGDSFGEQYDGLNIYKVGEMSPNWVASKQTYPMTRDCAGGHIYEAMAGKPVMLLEVPPIKYFDSNSVGVQSADTMGVDETAGYVYMVGLRIANLPGVLPVEQTGKPMCNKQPWSIVYIPRDALNSRVVASGILIDTFSGDANGRKHAVPKHGVNSDELLDRYIEKGGDTFNHEGEASPDNIYTFLSPDTLLGKVPLVANKFIRTYTLNGNGHRHGLYEESKKEVGFFGRAKDNRGCRETVSLHSGTAAYAEANILGISYAKGDSVIEPPPGIEVPLLNLNRETSVYLKLSSGLGKNSDKSFRADGEDHEGPVVSATAAYGHLIREMDTQYGSLINARYASIGLHSKGNSRFVEGLVGDSHVGSFNVRRTSYISNRVGDITFIPSPRHWKKIARFFGFGDPTEPPDSGDKEDPKNKANRHPGKGVVEAAAEGPGQGSVYYPGTLKCLVFFFCQSRVNAYYRQRGDDEGEVNARNLGKLHLDSSIPKGGRWEEAWLPRFYREIWRQSKFLSMLIVAIRVGIIIGFPLFVFIAYVLRVNTIWDIGPAIARGILYLATYIVAILVLSPSRLQKMMGLKDQLKDKEGGARDENLRQWEDNFMEYNSDYNEDNICSSYGISEPYNVCVCDKCSEATYYRPGGVPTKGISNQIRYSAKQYRDTEINAFNNVLDGDYGEMGTQAGQLQLMFSLNNHFYGLTTDGLYRISYNGNVQYRDLDYLLGNGLALGHPVRVGEGIEEGFRGTVDPNSFVITPYGAVWIDYKDKAVILFNGSQARVISDDYVSILMQNHMWFCNGNQCRDQKVKGVWFSIGFDPQLERLLVTKKDGAGGGSWTLSYDFEEKTWISSHSYIPNLYLWDRSKMFSVFENKVWKHNDPDNKQVFYGKYSPFKVYFSSANLANLPDHAAPMQIQSVEIHTIADDLTKGLMNRDITFTTGGWHNSYQSTGMFVLDRKYYKCPEHKDIREKGFESELYRTEPGLWRFNELKDLIADKNEKIIDSEECSFIRDLTENVDCKGGDGQKSVMADHYLRHCLIFDDPQTQNIELKLLRVIGYGDKKSS